MIRTLRTAGLAALALLAGCNATQLAYNQLDLLASWQVARYVDFTAAQESIFEREFKRAWTWHRSEELPRYARLMRRLAEPQARPDLAAFQAASSEYDAAWERILQGVAPIGCALGPTLDASQVEALLRAIDEDIADTAEELQEVTPEALRRERERELLRGLRRWLGELSPAQRELLHRWNESRPWIAPAWLDHRRRWRTAFAEVLAARQSPGFCARLTALLADGSQLWTPEQQALFAANRQAWLALFQTLGPTLSEAQRQAWRRSLVDLVDDLDALVLRAVAPQGPGGRAGR